MESAGLWMAFCPRAAAGASQNDLTRVWVHLLVNHAVPLHPAYIRPGGPDGLWIEAGEFQVALTAQGDLTGVAFYRLDYSPRFPLDTLPDAQDGLWAGVGAFHQNGPNGVPFYLLESFPRSLVDILRSA